MKEKDKKALHDQIVKEVKQDFEERRQKRRPVELAWRLNMNFLMGRIAVANFALCTSHSSLVFGRIDTPDLTRVSFASRVSTIGAIWL